MVAFGGLVVVPGYRVVAARPCPRPGLLRRRHAAGRGVRAEGHALGPTAGKEREAEVQAGRQRGLTGAWEGAWRAVCAHQVQLLKALDGGLGEEVVQLGFLPDTPHLLLAGKRALAVWDLLSLTLTHRSGAMELHRGHAPGRQAGGRRRLVEPGCCHVLW